MRKLIIGVRVLLLLAVAIITAVFLLATFVSVQVARDQTGTYAARLMWLYGAAAIAGIVYLYWNLINVRHLYRLPLGNALQRRDTAWLFTDLIAAPAGLLFAAGVTMYILSSSSYRAETLGSLGSIRSTLSLYYDDNDKHYPTSLSDLMASRKYIEAIPKANLWLYHSASSAVRLGNKPDDSGGWLYNNIIDDPGFGAVQINCTHTDWKGSAWNSY